MVYEVRTTESAEIELEEAYAWIHNSSPLNAERWRNELLEKAASLERFPERCPIAPESKGARHEIRQLVHGIYRVLFVIIRETVFVLHVRHGAREPLAPEELKEP